MNVDVRYLTRAFQLREHASEREKQTIAAGYYMSVTGELDKAERALREVVENYPRLQEFESMDVSPHVMLGACTWNRDGMRKRRLYYARAFNLCRTIFLRT